VHLTLERVKKCIDGLKEELGEGFLFTDIWNARDNKSVVFHQEYGMQPKHIKMFSGITGKLKHNLRQSDYPGLGDYYLVNLEEDHLALVLNYGFTKSGKMILISESNPESNPILDEYQQFILIDLSKTSMGIIMSVIIPNVLKSLE